MLMQGAAPTEGPPRSPSPVPTVTITYVPPPPGFEPLQQLQRQVDSLPDHSAPTPVAAPTPVVAPPLGQAPLGMLERQRREMERAERRQRRLQGEDAEDSSDEEDEPAPMEDEEEEVRRMYAGEYLLADEVPADEPHRLAPCHQPRLQYTPSKILPPPPNRRYDPLQPTPLPNSFYAEHIPLAASKRYGEQLEIGLSFAKEAVMRVKGAPHLNPAFAEFDQGIVLKERAAAELPGILVKFFVSDKDEDMVAIPLHLQDHQPPILCLRKINNVATNDIE